MFSFFSPRCRLHRIAFSQRGHGRTVHLAVTPQNNLNGPQIAFADCELGKKGGAGEGGRPCEGEGEGGGAGVVRLKAVRSASSQMVLQLPVKRGRMKSTDGRERGGK